MRTDPPFIAVDARLVGGTSTGDSTYWTCLIQALSRLQERPELRLYSDKPKPDLPFLKDLSWIHLPAKSSRWWSLVAFPLASRRGVVHTQYSLSPLIKQGITTIHDVSFFVGPQWFQPRDRLLLQKSVPAAAKRAKRVITVSETSRSEIEKFISLPPGRVQVTPLACPPWIEPSHQSGNFEQPYVLTVSTRWPRKNMGLAVEAMSLLPADLPHKLLLTGKHGWGSNELGSRGVATGYVSEAELSALYSGASLYLCPSRHEGFGLPVLEAFRCGCPVLASSGGALPETVGDAGQIEPSWDPVSWSRKIESLLRDRPKQEHLIRAGHEREKTYTWARCAEQTAAIYREVLSGH